MSYNFSLPTTGAVSFADYFESTGDHYSSISDATAQRGRLRTVLKGHKKESQESRDLAGIVNAIDDYLPYLISIINCLETKELVLKKNLETSWRSTLSDHIIHTKSNAPRIVGKDFYYELTFVLLTYAYAVSLQGSDYLLALQPNSQADMTMVYNKTADALNTAASVFHFVSDQVIPKWTSASDQQRPVETIREVSLALSKMTLADAQAVALTNRKLSNSLAAKLFIGVAEQYDMAYGLISARKSGQDVSSDLKKYLSDGSMFYKAMAKKYLAQDANDNQKMGIAVGFLRDCKADLRSLQHSSLSKPHIRKSTTVAARALKEEENVNGLLQRFTMINDTVFNQEIPSRQDLQKVIPSGRSALELKKYTPPPAVFGQIKNYGGDQEEVAYARSGRYW
ncbi:BRO1 domain-containing protein [Chlamydoabsidia padenii]|nr:BRO1 domain-containing protein [Chlamydoabsidia padenii]